MIRSSKHILKYQTGSKTKVLNQLFDDFRSDLSWYIDLIIAGQLPLTKFMSSKDLPSGIITHSAWKQILYKTASEIVRSQYKQASSRRFKHLKNKSKLSTNFMNKMQRWTYPAVLSKLESLAEMNGVHFTKVNPAYTSQTCSNCGCVDPESRQGEDFRCLHCGHEIDAD